MTHGGFAKLFEESQLPTSKYNTYFSAYDELFAKYRDKDVTFVEVGVMGGGSLQAFKRHFGAGSRIIGIDLNPSLATFLRRHGFEIFIGDAGDPAFWDYFFKTVGSVDVLLDDGGHTNHQMWTTFRHALPNINDGGCIVIEDLHASYMADFGNPSSDSFINRVKQCIDEVNYRSSRIEDKDRAHGVDRDIRQVEVSKAVHSISFFESIVGVFVDRVLCVESKAVAYGSLSALPEGTSLDDFRGFGIRDARSRQKLSIWKRFRSGIRTVSLGRLWNA